LSELLKAWYTFLALGLLSFVLLAFVGTPPTSLSSAVALPHRLLYAASTNLRGFLEGAADRRDLRAEVARLEARVAALEGRNRQLELSAARLRETLALREAQSPGVMMTAPVVSVDPSPLVGTLELGLGRADGVTVDMPVTVPAGLVGIVTGVAERSARVRTLTDSTSRVGVTVRGRGGQGIAVGEAGGLVRVTGYVEDAPIEVGDTVETSSRGGLFPRGITVGRVIRVFPKGANELRLEFLVRPSAEVERVLEVALIRPL